MISARTPQRIWNCKKKESELFDLTMCYVEQFGLLLAPSLLHNSGSSLVARRSDIKLVSQTASKHTDGSLHYDSI